VYLHALVKLAMEEGVELPSLSGRVWCLNTDRLSC